MILAASLFLGSAALPSMIPQLRRRIVNGLNTLKGNKPRNIHSEPSYNSSIIQLCVPQYGKEGMSLAFSNDLIIAKAIKGEFDVGKTLSNNIYFILKCYCAETRKAVYVRVICDNNSSKMHVLKYISELYSRLWDEMVFRNKVLLECVVFHDSQASDNSRRVMLRMHENEIEMVYVAKTYEPSDNDIRRDLGLNSLKVERVLFAADCSGMIFVDCEDQILPQFDIVALGGTFDRLHNGHRKLLSIGATVCNHTLVVGVMADNLLKSKTLSTLIHSFEARKALVINFLKEMKPDLPNVAISELNDPYGPALDPAVQAIVVSSETVGGANKINSIRKDRGLSELTVIVIRRSDVATLSSTFLREKESLSFS